MVHKKAAEPVARPVTSVTAALVPEATAAAEVALQVLPATFQLTTAGAQAAAGMGAGAVTQVAAGAASGLLASVPLVHAKNAEPVVGVVKSLAVALAPDAAANTLALQVLPATVQLTVAGAQSTGTGSGAGVALAQVAAGIARGVPDSAPLVHAKNAEPVVGAARSAAVALAPEIVAAALAVQVLPATVQLTDVATQAAAGVGTAKEVASVVELEPPPPHEVKKITVNNKLVNSAILNLPWLLSNVFIRFCKRILLTALHSEVPEGSKNDRFATNGRFIVSSGL